jgi:uncharacterized protein involved in exopolysaccharide biosynthesis
MMKYLFVLLFAANILANPAFAQDKKKNSAPQQQSDMSRQVLGIMREQILALSERFHNQSLELKAQYEGQTRKILDGYRKQIGQVKQQITAIENNLDELSRQLDKQARENDASLREQYEKLTKNLEESIQKLEKKLDSLNKN